MRNHWKPRDLILLKKKSLLDRIDYIHRAVSTELNNDQSVYARILGRMNNTIGEIYHPISKEKKEILMFGSNNYLGLASDIRVTRAAKKAIDQYGVGMCGSSFLNGNSFIQRELEELTAYLKNAEDCIVFSSGFNANTAWTSSLLRANDKVIYDTESHMSFREGIKATNAKTLKFKHNSIQELENALQEKVEGDTYIFTESLFSMTGDIVDIKGTYELSKKYESLLFIDEAHSTGILGKTGKGIFEDFRTKPNNVVTVGTYSKALGSNGGFICGNKDFINYLRVMSPQYMFSAALAPPSIAAAIASIKILLEEPYRVEKLRKNSNLANQILRHLGNISDDDSPVIYLKIGDKFDPLTAAKLIEEYGFFVNPISFPAVGIKDSGIRISISSEHTVSDIRRLRSVIELVWEKLS